MRFLAFTVLLLLAIAVAPFAHAADDFGNPFANQSYSAFGEASADTMADSAANAVSNIEPAAGDETPGEIQATTEDVIQKEATMPTSTEEKENLQNIEKEIEGALSSQQ